MTERVCTWDDTNPDERGKPTPEYIHLYEEWGKGAIGTIILGNIPCDHRYPEALRNAVLDPTSQWDVPEAFKPVIKAANAHGSIVIGQVTHAGRQTPIEANPHPVSSSDVQAPSLGGMVFGKPRPLTTDEINDVVHRFAFAAKALYDAGADGIQLHAAHGYLFSQFLSPRVNKRTDDYGGDSLDHRSRIVFEVVDAIKAKVNDPTFIIAIKINSADFAEGGFNDDESREVAVRLEAAGVDLIELSGGTYESAAFHHKKESTIKREAFFIEFAERIRPHLKTAVLCVTGGFRSAEGMARAVSGSATDLVGLARPLAAEPHLCADILSGASKGAKPNAVTDQLQTGIAIMQLGEIAAGKPLSDTSNEEVARRLEAEMMALYAKPNKPEESQPVKAGGYDRKAGANEL